MIEKILFLVLISFNLILFNSIDCKEYDVKTSSGLVRGQTVRALDQNVNQFLGIPFAEPPIGDLRFAKPKPIDKPLPGVIDATQFKYGCWQSPSSLVNVSEFDRTLSEDCLVLNVWSQSLNTNTSRLKPVMFFIHGGAFIVGSINTPLINGSALATKDVVVVATNYRLDSFGFLFGDDETAPGNVGLYDQVLALKWVRDNIHLFGGDKNQITIFGESAGSISVSVHLFSPISRGLFKRGILLSGALLFSDSLPTVGKSAALLEAKEIAKRLNCSDQKTWLQCLRKVSPKDLLEVTKERTFVLPIEGTEFLPKSAQKAFKEGDFAKDLELIAGVTRDEGTNLAPGIFDPSLLSKNNLTKTDFIDFVQRVNKFFQLGNPENLTHYYLKDTDLSDGKAIKWRIYDFVGDFLIKCPTYLFAKRYAERSADKSKVFFYELTYKMQNETVLGDVVRNIEGIYHGAEMPFTFGLPLLEPEFFTKTDIEFGSQMIELWTNFAKYGKPSESWKPLLISNFTETVVKDLNPTKVGEYFIDLFGETCDNFWKNYFN